MTGYSNEYVITSLLEIVGSEIKTRRPPPAGGTLDGTIRSHACSTCLMLQIDSKLANLFCTWENLLFIQ
jgi:hypothetical protein